jgi:hypothetical protein
MNNEETKKLADDALQQLETELKRGQSTTLRAYLAAMGRFHKYSLGNVLRITAQKPDARHVAGFHTWRRLGRVVRKGERGIAILSPIVLREHRNKDASKKGPKEQDQVPKPAGIVDSTVAFRGAYVFDISQTDGKPLPEFARVTGDPGLWIDRLTSFVKAQGIELEYSTRIAPAHGVSSLGKITLLPGLSPAETFSTLVHELTHELMHDRQERVQTNKTVRETEAEAVAFVVCQAAGLDVNSAASDYIQLWDGDQKTLKSSLERIRAAAVEIIRATEKHSSGTEPTQSLGEPSRASSEIATHDNATSAPRILS